MSRIFYFNVTYGCNNNCVFCYSHNTTHKAKTYKELSCGEFSAYLKDSRVKPEDRVIINGGEPTLHSQLVELLKLLDEIGCETLIYTNGRQLSKLYENKYKNRFRIIVPIHGDEETHDFITGVSGSYRDTIQELKNLTNNGNFDVDIKLILNTYNICDEATYESYLQSLSNISFNNYVHITKMADTVISKRNNIKSMSNLLVSKYIKRLFDYFVAKEIKVKLFDTCIYDIMEHYNPSINLDERDIEVYFKDYSQERKITLFDKKDDECSDCKYKRYCRSAVNEYKVLEYNNKGFCYELE